MDPQRHAGFVIGSDQAQQGDNVTVWKVRVKDPQSSFDGEKLVVASVHNGLSLAKGLNVHFAIGSVDGARGQKEPRAVDVRLSEPKPPRSKGQV
ncbi:MAG TPA: hypothetical protein VLA04_05195 [Verrucomicrobiae bacterium]|nr:hypothetical protein [Verrucomicrobiae bacterium]